MQPKTVTLDRFLKRYGKALIDFTWEPSKENLDRVVRLRLQLLKELKALFKTLQ